MKPSKSTVLMLILALLLIITAVIKGSLICGYAALVFFALSVVSVNGDITYAANCKTELSDLDLLKKESDK